MKQPKLVETEDAQDTQHAREALVDELTDEVIRVLGYMRRARRKGKRSRAKVNVDRIAKKHGVYRDLVDEAAGRCLLAVGLLRDEAEQRARCREVIDQLLENAD